MSIVNYLAQVYGFSMVVIGLAFLVNKKNVQSVFSIVEDRKMLPIMGVIGIMLGFATILAYGEWTYSWQVLVTIVGWVVIIRGFIALFFPDAIIEIAGKLKSKKDLISAALLVGVIVGCVLIYFGFAG